MISTKHATFAVAPASLNNSRWEIDIKEIYVEADSPAEAIAILIRTLEESK